MKNTKLKYNVNNVGVALLGDPQNEKTCTIQGADDPVRPERGITLIALIITIIVMLILVGVTINVSLNGGIFSKAKNAVQKTEEDAIYEEIISAMIINDYGKINVEETANEIIPILKERYGDNNVNYDETTGKLVIKDQYIYIISETEVIKGEKSSDNPWIVRGLGDTIIYDKIYSQGNGPYDQKLNVHSDGSGDFVFKESESFSWSSDAVDQYIEEKYFIVEQNSITLNIGSSIMTYIIKDSNTIEIVSNNDRNGAILTITD